MKQYEIKTVCTGTVYETWLVSVPDDVDTSGWDVDDWFDNVFDGVHTPSLVDEQVDDEHDRELRSATLTLHVPDPVRSS